MNARVEAGPLTYHVVAIVSEPIIRTEVTLQICHQSVPQWTCLSLVPISINGHSLNAINPDFSKAGELTTSVLA